MKTVLKRIFLFSALVCLTLLCLAFLSGCECTHYYYDTVTKQPTCMESGEVYRECYMCGDSYTDTIYPSEEYHVLEEVSVDPPTCATYGRRNMRCTVCGFEGYYEIPATNAHDYQVSSRTEPTCTELGQEIRTCTGCGNTVAGYINSLGHSWGEPVTTDATCTVDGSIVTSCQRCDEQIVEVITASHRYTEAVVTQPATCLEEGREEYTCLVCLDTGYNVLPPLGHNVVDAIAVAPTCQTEGSTVGTKCSTCNATVTGMEPIPTVDHSYGDNAACIWCQTLRTYTVTYVTEGDVTFPMETYSHGATITLPDYTLLENEHTAFVGWFTSDDVEYTATSTVTGDVTLYARLDSYVPVSDLSGLLAIASAPDKNYKLTSDIDAEGVIWTPVDNFTGSLNGDGHVIYNIVLTTTESLDFGFVRVNNGIIRNLSFKDFTFNATYTHADTKGFGVVAGVNNGIISGVRIFDGRFMINATRHMSWGATYSSYGAVTGRNTAGAEVKECYVNLNIEVNVDTYNNLSASGTYWDGASVSGTFYIGGVVGRNESKLSTCEFDGAITCKAVATSTEAGWDNHYASNTILLGTVVGENVGFVERCYTRGEISTSASVNRSSSSNHYAAGVLVGKNLSGGTVEFSFASGSISTGSANTSYTGGFIGFNESNSYVKSCYTTAYVESNGGSYAGGFIGINSGVVQNSYSAGEVLASGSGRTGGFVGSLSSSGTISKCYSTGDVAGAGGSIGHFVGYAEGVVLKCYFMDSSTVMSGGTYLPIVTEYNTIEGIVYTRLWNEDFLINEMYWEDYGWIVIADQNPLLAWEIDTNHEFIVTEVEPTCERGGFKIYNCTDCGRLFIKDYVDPLGHDMVTDSVIPPSCSARGFTEKHCQREECGYEVQEDFTEKIPHREEGLVVKEEVAPTCTEQGYTRFLCSDCQNADIYEYHEPLGHDGTLVNVLIEVSCDRKGLEEYLCSREGCGEYTVIVDELPHTPEAVPYLAPSCGKDFDPEGNPVYNSRDGHMPGEICSVCDQVLSGCDPLPAHTFELKTVTTPAGCLTEGEGTYVCFDCGFDKTDVIAAKGHTDTNLNNICDECEQFTFTTVPESMFTVINDIAGLEAIRNNLGGYYILGADLDLTGYSWTPIGTEYQPFKGMLYGAGHTVKGLTFTVDGGDEVAVFGLFGYNSGTIVSLNVEGLDVTVKNAHCYVGGIAAYNKGTVMGCSVKGNSVFRLSLALDVTDYTHHTLERVMNVGGIVGVNDQTGVVEYCEALGHIDAILDSNTKISSSDAKSFLLALIYNTKAETDLDVTFGAIAGKNEGAVNKCNVKERVGVTMAFRAELAYQKGRINAAFNVYAADIIGYNSGTVTECTGIGSAYTYLEGYNYKNFIDKFFKGKLCEITVTFVNHSEGTDYAGLIGGNEGTVRN